MFNSKDWSLLCDLSSQSTAISLNTFEMASKFQVTAYSSTDSLCTCGHCLDAHCLFGCDKSRVCLPCLHSCVHINLDKCWEAQARFRVSLALYWNITFATSDNHVIRTMYPTFCAFHQLLDCCNANWVNRSLWTLCFNISVQIWSFAIFQCMVSRNFEKTNWDISGIWMQDSWLVQFFLKSSLFKNLDKSWRI
jgi:hypothetical protein